MNFVTELNIVDLSDYLLIGQNKSSGPLGVDVLNLLEAKFNFQTNFTIFAKRFSENGVSSENFIDRYYISQQLKTYEI